MSKRSSFFLHVIQIKFKDNAFKKKCIDAVNQQINKNIPNRMFDHFPCDLLPKEKLSELTGRFRDIILQIHEDQSFDNELKLTDRYAKKEILRLVDEIAAMGFAEVLDDQQNSDTYATFLQLLELTDKKISKRDVLCAYIGANFAKMAEKLSSVSADCSNACAAICHFVNKNYGTVVDRLLDQSEFKEKYGSGDNSDIFSWPIEHPKESLLILGGFAAAAALFSIFASAAAKEDHSPSVKSPHTPPSRSM